MRINVALLSLLTLLSACSSENSDLTKAIMNCEAVQGKYNYDGVTGFFTCSWQKNEISIKVENFSILPSSGQFVPPSQGME